MLLILLVFCDVLVLGMSMLLILLVFCGVVFLGIYFTHLVSFLCCVYIFFVFVLCIRPNVSGVSGLSFRISLTFIHQPE
jgi:hypothetical protein